MLESLAIAEQEADQDFIERQYLALDEIAECLGNEDREHDDVDSYTGCCHICGSITCWGYCNE